MVLFMCSARLHDPRIYSSVVVIVLLNLSNVGLLAKKCLRLSEHEFLNLCFESFMKPRMLVHTLIHLSTVMAPQLCLSFVVIGSIYS